MPRNIRVMQSFRAPRVTTNPYITMLDSALGEANGMDHLRFSWLRALLGKYQVFHWHWPEGKLEGRTWWKKAGKHALLALVLIRQRLTRTVVVRTVHNLDLPQGISPVATWILRYIDRHTDYRIVLNATTPLRPDQPHSMILHGHYRDWYTQRRSPVVAGQVGYFGMIRRYKSLDRLLSAYAEASLIDPGLSLRIGGRPSSPELGAMVGKELSMLGNVTAKLEFLDDAELVDLASSSELIILPYRHMHNSGSVLAALSLGRPVLVPRNAANAALAAEVGEAWVQQFDGELDGATVVAALQEVRRACLGEPNLVERDWDRVGRQHFEAYSKALQSKDASSAERMRQG